MSCLYRGKKVPEEVMTLILGHIFWEILFSFYWNLCYQPLTFQILTDFKINLQAHCNTGYFRIISEKKRTKKDILTLFQMSLSLGLNYGFSFYESSTFAKNETFFFYYSYPFLHL